MKTNILKTLIYFSLILIAFFSSSFLLIPFNDSVVFGFKIILFVFFAILFLGTLISKISFYICKKEKLKILNIKTFNKNEIFKSISKTLIILLLYFSITYMIIYFCGNTIFSKLNYSTGIINSCNYISKIFLLSLPIASFEITFLEYCNFLRTIHIPIILALLKFLIWFILSFIFANTMGINGFLYTKVAIDIFFFPYYIIKIKQIVKLTK